MYLSDRENLQGEGDIWNVKLMMILTRRNIFKWGIFHSNALNMSERLILGLLSIYTSC